MTTVHGDVPPTPTGPVLTLRGDLDSRTSPEFAGKLGGLVLNRGELLVVDLQDLTFCDSSGIAAFIAARNAVVPAHAGLVLAGVSSQIRRILAMIGLEELFDTRGSVEEAVAAHRAGL